MISEKEKKEILKFAEEFFQKTTTAISKTEIDLTSEEVVSLKITLDEPQILIGQSGQTLFEIQRLLKMILNKKLQKPFYLDLDINDYKAKKTEYLKAMAKDLADQAVLQKEKKSFMPMSSYERRIIHAELAGRSGIITESQGEGLDRHVVIIPK